MSTVKLGRKGKGQRIKTPGFWGRLRLNGKSAKLLKNSLERAENKRVETKRQNLITCNIKFCPGFSCSVQFKPVKANNVLNIIIRI